MWCVIDNISVEISWVKWVKCFIKGEVYTNVVWKMSIGKMKGRATAEICADCSAPGMILCYSFLFEYSALLI